MKQNDQCFKKKNLLRYLRSKEHVIYVTRAIHLNTGLEDMISD